MDFLQTSHIAEKAHECLYCSQKYPSERDLSIHEYIHGSYEREAIFNLTIQPRNSYLIYEDFNFVCGRMKSGLMFKELGSAETPEQERFKSPNKKEFDKSSPDDLPCHHLTPAEYSEKYFNNKQIDKSPMKNLPCHHFTPPEYNEKYFNKTQIDKSPLNNLPCHRLTPPQSDEKRPNKKQFHQASSNSQHLTSPQLDKKSPDKKESDTTSNNVFCHNFTLPHYQEQASYSSKYHANLFAYKSFEGVYSKESEEDGEILMELTEDLLEKYRTFPTTNNAKSRENWADRYKTSLKSEADGRGDPTIAFFSPGIRF